MARAVRTIDVGFMQQKGLAQIGGGRGQISAKFREIADASRTKIITE